VLVWQLDFGFGDPEAVQITSLEHGDASSGIERCDGGHLWSDHACGEIARQNRRVVREDLDQVDPVIRDIGVGDVVPDFNGDGDDVAFSGSCYEWDVLLGEVISNVEVFDAVYSTQDWGLVHLGAPFVSFTDMAPPFGGRAVYTRLGCQLESLETLIIAR
jgi:hypothetical protein